jgi:ligand-binding SRPBCC domain-containing protein
MTSIYLQTRIKAPLEICFHLSRSLDLHQLGARESKEVAVAGRKEGLIESGEFVTWEATHFFIRLRMSVKIVEMHEPLYFKDMMIDGPFASMCHVHKFERDRSATLMTDEFHYEVPFGLAGKIFDKVILRRYMLKLLKRRNSSIRDVAESGTHSQFLNALKFTT